MYTTTLAPPLGRLKGKRGRAEHSARLRETLCEIARARAAAPPGGIYGGQGGACSSKRGATFYPLWHSATFPDPTFRKIQIFENIKNRLVSKIDLAGSRRVRRNYFSKMPGNIPPKDPFAKGGRHIWSRFCTLPDFRIPHF